MKQLLLPSLLLLPFVVLGDDNIATLRDGALNTEPGAPKMSRVETRELRRKRNYPMQPPTIPHKIDGYYIDLNSNKCLSCHSRRQIEESQAPMVSVTHYMDRDGNFLAEVSPRRYFCNQCHVPQLNSRTLVDSNFQDMDTLLDRARPGN